MTMLGHHLESSLPVGPFRSNGLQDPGAWPASWTRLELKLTPSLDMIALPRPDMSGDLANLLRTRSSRRNGGRRRWDLDQIGALLGHAVAPRQDEDGVVGGRRAYPSAGARFPIEIYVAADGLSDRANVFHYRLTDHTLHGVRRMTDPRRSMQATFGVDWAASAYGAIFLTAVLERSARKYRERAYRYAFLESGHLAQNLLLVAEALGTGATPVGGFSDRMVGALVGANGEQEVVTYAIVLT